MKIPCDSPQAEIEVKKSRFISKIFFVKQAGEVKPLIKSLWKEHPQARHIVWAFVCGENGETAGRSDDGEPSGTAGNPTLEQIRGAGATATLVATIRYFGGIKLGTGGLVRAYAESAKAVLNATAFTKLEKRYRGKLTLPYPLYEPFLRLIQSPEIVSVEENFTDEVGIVIEYPFYMDESLKKQVVELTLGQCSLQSQPLPSPIDPDL